MKLSTLFMHHVTIACPSLPYSTHPSCLLPLQVTVHPPFLSIFSPSSLSPQFLSKDLHSLFFVFFHSPSQLGHANIVELLLQAGAKTHTTNNGGKTAVQLGAFIGESVVCVCLCARPCMCFNLCVSSLQANMHVCVL